MNRGEDRFYLIAIAIVTVWLYHKVTRLWWTYDDAYLLHVAVAHSASDHFFGSSIWRSMPQHLFTPLLTASYDAGLSIVGLNAAAFHASALVLLASAAVAIFWTARMWMSSSAAAVATVLFVAGVPVCSLASQLMLVHYLESILFAALSAGVFAKAIRAQDRRMAVFLSILSALLYLGAMLAKEIAVPLPAAFLLFVERKRLQLTAPHWIALVLYAAWRRSALGEWLGGYGWTIRIDDVPHVAAILPVTLFHQLAGPAGVIGAALVLVVVAGVVLYSRSRNDALVVLILIILSVGPIVPMARKFEPRFATAPWLVLVVLACAAFAKIRPAARAAVFAGVTLLSIVVNRQAWAREYALSQRMSAEEGYS